MRICQKCKTEVPDDTYFCEKCGGLISDKNETATPTVQLDSNVEQEKQPFTPEPIVFTPPEASTTTNHTTAPARPATGGMVTKVRPWLAGLIGFGVALIVASILRDFSIPGSSIVGVIVWYFVYHLLKGD